MTKTQHTKFKQKLHETAWDNIQNIKKPNEAYRKFVDFSVAYRKT